jgi:acetyltransferase-like isoleucine patch superfamily enzyme
MISPVAVVETADIGADVTVKEFAVIRPGVRLGNNVIVHPHVVIETGVIIGDDVEIFPGAYIGKEPKSVKGVLARPISFEARTIIGPQVSIGPGAVIYYDVEIGEASLIGDGASIREKSRIGTRSVIGRHVTVNYNCQVGDRTKVMDHSWLAGNMRVGNDVFISGGVLTTNDNMLGGKGYSDDRVQGPYIADGVMIGVAVAILPGVTIGKNAIIGAGAVVTRDVEPHTVVMGVPARFKKFVSDPARDIAIREAEEEQEQEQV